MSMQVKVKGADSEQRELFLTVVVSDTVFGTLFLTTVENIKRELLDISMLIVFAGQLTV